MCDSKSFTLAEISLNINFAIKWKLRTKLWSLFLIITLDSIWEIIDFTFGLPECQWMQILLSLSGVITLMTAIKTGASKSGTIFNRCLTFRKFQIRFQFSIHALTNCQETVIKILPPQPSTFFFFYSYTVEYLCKAFLCCKNNAQQLVERHLNINGTNFPCTFFHIIPHSKYVHLSLKSIQYITSHAA